MRVDGFMGGMAAGGLAGRLFNPSPGGACLGVQVCACAGQVGAWVCVGVRVCVNRSAMQHRCNVRAQERRQCVHSCGHKTQTI